MKDKTAVLDTFELISLEDAEKNGISKYLFYKYLKEKEYLKVAPGEYAPSDAWVDRLYLIHRRCPKAVFSHDEAFYYHGLTDREPLSYTMTVYSGYNPHRINADGDCKVYSVKKELLDVGKTYVIDTFGNEIPIYDMERSICDLIRSRSSIEIQTFTTVLKSYVARSDKDPGKLMEYAKLFSVQKILRTYMEILL